MRALAGADFATRDRANLGADFATRDRANLRSLLALCNDKGGFGARQLRYREAAGFEGRVQALAAAAGSGGGDNNKSGPDAGADGVIDEAFVGFVAGEGFAALMAVAVEACAENSQRPFVLFAAGAVGEGAAAARLWPPARFPRLVVLAMPAAELHPWFDKLRAALLAPVRFAVIVEADSLATRHVDRLFHVLRREPDYGFPLMPVHMHLRHPDCEVVDGAGVTLVSLVPGDPRRRICGAPFATPLAERTTRYGHAHIVMTSAAKGLVAEVVAACGGGAMADERSIAGGQGSAAGREEAAGRLRSEAAGRGKVARGHGELARVAPPLELARVVPALRGIDCSSDESALNTALWQRGARRQLCLADPIFNVFDAWRHQRWADTGIAPGRAESWSTFTVAFTFLHGEKGPAEARALLANARALPPGTHFLSHDGVFVNDSVLLDEAWRGVDGCEI